MNIIKATKRDEVKNYLILFSEVIFMSLKKSIFYFVSLVYAIILLHNLTPHVHGSDNHKSFGLLSDWFQLFFGSEHHQSQDNRHLSTFSIQDDDLPEWISFEISDLAVLHSAIFTSKLAAGLNLPESAKSISHLKVKFYKNYFVSAISGRAPPFFAETAV